MITGELKSKIDKIWDTMWSGGVSNPLSVIEQLTYGPEALFAGKEKVISGIFDALTDLQPQQQAGLSVK